MTMSQEGITLSQLCKQIFRALDDKFAFERIWVRAEISSCSSSRGHHYLQLVEEAGGQMQAKVSANLWSSNFKRLQRTIGSDLEELLFEGTKVLLQVRVDFHPIYGLKLNVEDIDPAYTYGELAIRKQQTIAKLKKEGLDQKNKELDFPAVAQRIALVASSSSAGYADFIDQLANNPYGYEFKIQLFDVGVQGSKAEAELVKAFEKINAKKADLAVVIRGGGSKLDLDVFNSYDLCAAIAKVPVPVISGIGHQTDWLVADLVAAQALKTPTATADFLIQQMVDFETNVIESHQQIIEAVMEALKDQRRFIDSSAKRYSQASVHRLQSESKNLLRTAFGLSSASKSILEQNRLMNSKAKQRLKSCGDLSIDSFVSEKRESLSKLVAGFLEKRGKELSNQQKAISYLSPLNVLKRGYSITTFEGRTVSDDNLPTEGDALITQSASHRMESVLSKIEKDED